MRDYNRFINSVLENPLLRSSEIIEEFITKNQNDFHVIKLKYIFISNFFPKIKKITNNHHQ